MNDEICFAALRFCRGCRSEGGRPGCPQGRANTERESVSQQPPPPQRGLRFAGRPLPPSGDQTVCLLLLSQLSTTLALGLTRSTDAHISNSQFSSPKSLFGCGQIIAKITVIVIHSLQESRQAGIPFTPWTEEIVT